MCLRTEFDAIIYINYEALVAAAENQRVAGTQKNTADNSGVRYSIADVASGMEPEWRNVDYTDEATKKI